MLLKQLFEETKNAVTFCFGRMNPPTIGHKQVLDTMRQQDGEMKIFVSQSQDPKKNPLDYATKIEFIKAMFPEYANDVVKDSSLNTAVKVASYLYDQGYTAATFVAGSDRLEDMKKLLEAYNGVEGKAHGYYKFETLDFVSSGEREDGAEGVAGISASGARAAAANGDLEAFKEATGAGDLSEKLYSAVRKGMGISESYKIAESVSIDSAIKNIVATGDSVAKTYGDLKTMAEKWVYNNGTLKGFHRNAAGVGKRWYDTFFWNKMENDLRTLLQKNPKAAAKIQDFLNIEKDDRGHVSFNIIGRSLPRILNDVGEKMGDDDLKRFGANWFKRHKDYEDYLDRVEKEVNDEEDDDDFAPAPKQPKDNVVGRQNAAAEDMVNQILKSIDKKVAGEIRNIIAREPNKLQALQKELAKRNIKVGESTYRMELQGVAEGKIKLSTDPNWYGAEVGDYKASGPVVNIQANQLVGFEPDDKMNQPKSKANVKKIVAGLKKGDKLPPILVRKYKKGYQVLDGHHRFWAYKLLQIKSIPAQIVPAKDIKEISKQDVAEGSYTTEKQILTRIRQIMHDRKLSGTESNAGELLRLKKQLKDLRSHLESIQEAPIEMDPADPMDPMIYGHDKANPGKLKYRMARAAGQLKDLASRVDDAGPEQWQRMAQQFEELKMNMEQIRHALEELGKVRKKGGIRSRGITV